MDLSEQFNQAQAAYLKGDYASADRQAREILRHAPNDAGTWALIAKLAIQAQQPEKAVDILRQVIPSAPQLTELWLDLARAYGDMRMDEEALAAAEKAAEVAPKRMGAHLRVGELNMTLGRREAAAAAYRRALAIEPDRARLYRQLSMAESLDPNGPEMVQARRLLENPDLPPGDKADLHYALTSSYRNGDKDLFIKHMFAANAAQAEAVPADREHHDRVLERIKLAYTAETLARAPKAPAQPPTPIFVLGMPRSGTTLMEQILSAHPDVASGGELNYITGPGARAIEHRTKKRFPLGFEELPPEEMLRVAQGYRNRIAPIARGRPYVVDKTPGYFHALGLLTVLFPDCKIVAMRRDPMDTCFSILQYPFRETTPQSFNLPLLARYYARHRQMMRLWGELLPGRFITVQYEQLVSSPAEEGRRVFEHCGLAWSDDYLNFHEKQQSIRTFSTEQARKPVYQSSIGAWRQYEAALKPLKDALDRELAEIGE